jgi:hypothetical protein
MFHDQQQGRSSPHPQQHSLFWRRVRLVLSLTLSLLGTRACLAPVSEQPAVWFGPSQSLSASHWQQKGPVNSQGWGLRAAKHALVCRTDGVWGPFGGESIEPLTTQKVGGSAALLCRVHGSLHTPWRRHMGGCRAFALAVLVFGGVGPLARLGCPAGWAISRRCKGVPSTAGAATLCCMLCCRVWATGCLIMCVCVVVVLVAACGMAAGDPGREPTPSAAPGRLTCTLHHSPPDVPTSVLGCTRADLSWVAGGVGLAFGACSSTDLLLALETVSCRVSVSVFCVHTASCGDGAL